MVELRTDLGRFRSVLAGLMIIAALPAVHRRVDAVSPARTAQGGCDAPPAAPKLLAIAVSGKTARVSWQAAAVGCRATSYLIETGSAPGRSDLATVPIASAATTITLKNVADGLYYVRLRAGNDEGLSPPSNELTASIGHSPCGGLPPPPHGVFADVKGTTIDVVWEPSFRSPNGYLVEAGSSPGLSDRVSQWTATSDHTLAVTAKAGRYFLRVRARNACGVGDPSREIIVETGGHPGVPDVVIAARTADRNTYFPSVERLRNGHLIVVYYDSPDHASPLGRISLVKSVDGGRTWSTPRIAIDSPLDDRDPSIMQTRAGTVLLSFFSPGSSTGSPDPPGVFVARSEDEGGTWSTPVKVETTLNTPATSARIVELENGDLLMPVYGTPAGHARSAILRSVDGGRTWPKTQEVQIGSAARVDLVEPALVNLGGGRLLAMMRAEGSDIVARESRSPDGGHTWSEPVKTGVAAMASDLLLVPVGSARQAGVVHTWGDWSRRFGDSRATLIQLIEFPARGEPVYYDPHVVHNTHCDDTAVPSSVLLDDGRLFTVYYDACFGYIGGNFLTLDQLRR